ncbi:oxygenase MpaB family protein [Gordonia iterans]
MPAQDLSDDHAAELARRAEDMPRSRRDELDHVETSDIDMVGPALLAGTANVIMQLSVPAVGYGVYESKVESGNVLKHPVKRTRTTLTYLAVAARGTPELRKAYGTTLQMPRELWPATRADFEQYWQSVLAEIEIDDTIRKYLLIIASMKVTGVRAIDRPLQWWSRMLTFGFLPPE